MIEFTVYQPSDEIKHVHACEMTDKQFKYRCKCRDRFHIHGNGGDPHTNRCEYRSSHCTKDDREVCIHIDERTNRKLKHNKSKANKKSKA